MTDKGHLEVASRVAGLKRLRTVFLTDPSYQEGTAAHHQSSHLQPMIA